MEKEGEKEKREEGKRERGRKGEKGWREEVGSIRKEDKVFFRLMVLKEGGREGGKRRKEGQTEGGREK